MDKLITSTGKLIQSLHSTEYMYLLCEVKELVRTNQIFLKYQHDSKEFLKCVLVKLVALQIKTVSKILKSPLKVAFGISWLWGLRLEELKRKEKKCANLIPSWGLLMPLTGEGNGNPLRCSCLENPRDQGAWCAAVYGVAQGRTRLKRLSSGSSSMPLTMSSRPT